MKRFTFLFLLSGLLFSSGLQAQNQSTTDEASVIEMTPDELRVLIRKMAIMRQRRYLMLQQRQRMMMRRTAKQQATPSQSNKGDGAQVQKTVEQQTITVLVREDADGNVDTLVTQEQGIVSQQENMTTLRKAQTSGNSGASARQAKSANPAAGPSDVDDLRRRLDRQESMLAELLAREPSPTVYPTMPVMPYRTDTVVQRIISDPASADRLSRSDLDALTTELKGMNEEINDLRRQLAEKEDQRIAAERRANTRADELYDRAESDRFKREMRQRERELERQRDLDRRQREITINTATPDVSPTIIQQPGEVEVRIIRDTVYVDRVSTTPVFIPTEPDTVIKVREVIREVPAEPVVRTETVVRKDTVKLEATEPISYPTIFFDNNSSRLNANHLNLLATTAQQVSNRNGYIIRLVGYASPSGNATYNQDLSAKRAEAVRQGLINAGVADNRIRIIPGGVDYAPKNAAAARRVEIQAVPR